MNHTHGSGSLVTSSENEHSHNFFVYGASFATGNSPAALFTGYPHLETRATFNTPAHNHTISGSTGNPDANGGNEARINSYLI